MPRNKNPLKAFEILIEFPGQVVRDKCHYRDRTDVNRGESERTAEQQMKDFVRSQEYRYKKYGAKVSWKALET